MPLIDSTHLASTIVNRLTEQHTPQLLATVDRLHLRLPAADTATIARAEDAFRQALVRQIDTAISDGCQGLRLALERGSLDCWLASALDDALAAAGCP